MRRDIGVGVGLSTQGLSGSPSFWNAESVILELKEQENSHKAHFSGFL